MCHGLLCGSPTGIQDLEKCWSQIKLGEKKKEKWGFETDPGENRALLCVLSELPIVSSL